MEFLSVLRVLRLARIFKLLRMGNAVPVIQLVSSTAGAAIVDSLPLMTTLLMVTAIATIVFSAALSQIEPGDKMSTSDDPSDSDTWFRSVTRTIWWSLVTLTGVGYGDEYPMLAPGRTIAILCATVGIIIIAVPIEVIGRYFGSHFIRTEYTRRVQRGCEKADGTVDVRALWRRLQVLARQGLLRVRCPASEADMAEVVAAYDATGDGRLETDEWGKFVEDVIAHRGDWEGCAVRQTVDYLFAAKREVRQAASALETLMLRRAEQHAELCKLVRTRFPHGIPKGGLRRTLQKRYG